VTGARESGFTLVEVLLSVVIVGMLVGLSLPIYQSFQNRNELDIAAEGIAGMLRRAQVYSRGVSGDSQWGVHVETGSATLFKGASYAGRDATYDETAAIPSSFTVSASDVRFSKLTGMPIETGTIATITSLNNETRTVTINGKGTVSY
jgi:prepilin-type N-terminal cleavage/methylation domain-containing protein